MLQQAEEDQHWGGNGNGWASHGSQRLKATEGSSFVQEVDGAALRSGGGGEGGYRGGFVHPLTVSSGNCSDFGADLTLLSPSDLFIPSPRQPLLQNSSSPFSWQSLLGGGQASARWRPDTSLPGFTTFGGEPRVEQAKSLNAYALGEKNVRRGGGDGGQNELCLAHESSAGDGVISEGEADRFGEVKEEWTNNVNSEKENWRKFGGMSLTFNLL